MDTPAPSQFSHEILNANPYAYLDDAPLEERRARAVSMRRALPETVLTDIGRLDPAAIAQVRAEAWPDVRDADELNEVLQVFVGLSRSGSRMLCRFVQTAGGWPSWIDFSRTCHRRTSRTRAVGRSDVLGRGRKEKAVFRFFPEARFDSALPELNPVR